MTPLMIWVLLFSLFLLIYVYVFYPLAVWLLGKIYVRGVERHEGIKPSVALVICAYNEEAVIARKLHNSLALDYPADHLQILVASDHSNDRTDAIIQSFKDPRIIFYASGERLGKTALINKVVPLTRADILVFTDANALFQPSAIKNLVRNFADPSVGYVTGRSRYSDTGDSDAASSEGLYWRYEDFIKMGESRLGGMVGADGAIYAVHRELYRPLRPGDINDFVNPLQVVVSGWRGVYDPEAVCWEATSGQFEGEFRRKARIVTRCLRGLARVPSALNPLRTGWFALALISHKLLRWLVPFFLIQIFFSSLWLAWPPVHPAFFAILSAQLFFYALAMIGWGLHFFSKLWFVFYLPYYFCLINAAALVGVLRFFRGRDITTWEPQRGLSASSAQPAGPRVD